MIFSRAWAQGVVIVSPAEEIGGSLRCWVGPKLSMRFYKAIIAGEIIDVFV